MKLVKIINVDKHIHYLFDSEKFVCVTTEYEGMDVYQIKILLQCNQTIEGYIHIGFICYLESFFEGDWDYENSPILRLEIFNSVESCEEGFARPTDQNNQKE